MIGRGCWENIPRPWSWAAPPAVPGHHLPHLVGMAGEMLLQELGKALQREQSRQEPERRIGGLSILVVPAGAAEA